MSQQHLSNGTALLQQSQYPSAIIEFEAALRHDITSVDAWQGKALCHAQLQDWLEALNSILNALQHGQHRLQQQVVFIQILQTCQLKSYAPPIEEALIQAQNASWLEGKATELLSTQLKAKYLTLLSGPSDALVFNQELQQLLQDNTLCQVIDRVCIDNYSLEKAILLGRHELLKQAVAGDDIGPYLQFLAAFASQMLINDNLYATSEAELPLLTQLIASGAATGLPALLLRLCYATFSESMDIWNAYQMELMISEHSALVTDLMFYAGIVANQERGNVADETSQKVQSFYIDNPYPKYKALITSPITIAQIFSFTGKAPGNLNNALVAGCGTGRQVIEMALANPNIEITAIDLSPASLTFARQMAQRYEADNITFELLDILDVEKLGQKFDYILCTGVLHHMASPQAGLNALSKVVSADGIMLLGFYSKLGRQELAGIKQQALDYLDVEASQITTQGVRQWRGNLSMDVAKNTPWYKVQDFFNLNGLFDLLFHPQEQAYELPQLAQMLDIAGVNFEWMAISNQQKAQYKQPLIENPTPDKSEAMAFWHQFESQHPAFFNGMFNFVVSPK